MALSVSLGGVSGNGNPTATTAGAFSNDAVTLNSGLTGVVKYQIRRKDRVPMGSGNTVALTVTSNVADVESPLIVSKTAATLKIVLPFRTRFEFRVSNNGGGTWSAWYAFKTRDKKYSTPDMASQLLIDYATDTRPSHVRETVTVTNSARATVVATSTGATVTNGYLGYNDTTAVTETRRGATVTN